MITLRSNDPTPPFEQVRKQLADAIRIGDLQAHERLPSIRQLAGDLRVAPGTVARAYQQLEAEGLIATSRARGTTVSEAQTVSPYVIDQVSQMLISLDGEPLHLTDLLAAVTAVWNRRSKS